MPDPSAHKGNDGDDSTTKSTRTRWEWTGTLAAFALVMTACAAVLIPLYRGDAVPLWATVTFGLSALASVAWAFGESALRAATEARSK
ncbi:putative protein 6 [Haloarcula hispanica icosahedral virus 2]|uniref:Uncharacterized protein n=1 Tax=Haloarcula hispanica icosahedral virus 2 TaxID=1154689 RepID=H9AZW2_9VIRU|nr:putative protein 6 [Haloarcula hispanica icosahedral virus 2]AFD02287.1 putative protein 6 [Haloarcula hispanica icosahedral virus 2]